MKGFSVFFGGVTPTPLARSSGEIRNHLSLHCGSCSAGEFVLWVKKFFINVFFAIELFELITILNLFYVITFWLAFPKLAMNTQWTPMSKTSCGKGAVTVLSWAQEHSTVLLRHLDAPQKNGHKVNNQTNPNTPLKELVLPEVAWLTALDLPSDIVIWGVLHFLSQVLWSLFGVRRGQTPVVLPGPSLSEGEDLD